MISIGAYPEIESRRDKFLGEHGLTADDFETMKKTMNIG